MYREAGHLKIFNPLIRGNANIERDDRAEEPTLEDWREKIPAECQLSVSPREDYH